VKRVMRAIRCKGGDVMYPVDDPAKKEIQAILKTCGWTRRSGCPISPSFMAFVPVGTGR